jgi:hypothetical protein
MNTRTLGWLIGLSAISSSFLSCSQPAVVCTAAHAGSLVGFAAVYELKGESPSGCGAMADHPSGAKLNELTYETVGFETYHPIKVSENGQEPDFTKTTIAVQSDALGSLAKARPSEEGGQAYSLGTFTNSEPDADGFCPVKDIEPAELSFPVVPAVPDDPMTMDEDESTPEEPAVNIKYAWKNLKIYVTAAAQGTQFSGDLTYTQDTCAVDYKVIGFWPEVGCEGVGLDEMGKEIAVPDDSLCCPNADPEAGRITGSGINPDFPVKCDPNLLICVLDRKEGQDIPVLSPDWSLNARACKPTPAAEK